MKKKILMGILAASFLVGCGENLKELPKEITADKKFADCDRILNEFLSFKGWNWTQFLESSNKREDLHRSFEDVNSHREYQYLSCVKNILKPETKLERLKEKYKNF